MIPDWAGERERMVEEQMRGRGIRDPRVLQAMRTVPREWFVPQDQRIFSYTDQPLPIGWGQTISQPYMVALMAESLHLSPSDRVLEIGAGCGYHAAVLAQLASSVCTVEVLPGLAKMAALNLERAGLKDRVLVVTGDGSEGWAEFAPYDAISVAAGAPDVPLALVEQLVEGGRLVIPVGPPECQDLLLWIRRAGWTEKRSVTACRFVPLRGTGGWGS
ncbi:MAG: protein-L-isoaspartate(D-aspartate) O-methyltransferase [Bryobacteraceae bacterium]